MMTRRVFGVGLLVVLLFVVGEIAPKQALGLSMPTVSAVAPDRGPGAGGTPVTITGTNFVTGATVSFGGSAATGVVVRSSTSISAKTPAHAAGKVDVVVTNPDGQSGSLTNGFTYGPCVGCEGWDGPGLGCANVTYHFVSLPVNRTIGLTDAQVKAEVVRAMRAWSQVACIHFTETSTANLPMSIDIEWDTGNYGPYYSAPFPEGVMAQTYYATWLYLPPLFNGISNEPTAGNIYFNNAYNWSVDGSGFDIFSVALHELGRALGLDTSSDPTAVMYLQYQGKRDGLAQDDIDGIQFLYARDPASPPTPLPLPHEVGIYRNGTWYLNINGNGVLDGCTTDKCVSWGGDTKDVPVVGDWNGDGKTKIGIYRSSTGMWYLDLTGNGTYDGCVSTSKCLSWGGDPTDKVVVGQW